jgi:hypothetical protein
VIRIRVLRTDSTKEASYASETRREVYPICD